MIDQTTGKAVLTRTEEFMRAIAALALEIPPGSTIDARLRAAEDYGRRNVAEYTPSLFLVGEFMQLANAVAILDGKIDLRRHWGRLIQKKDFPAKFLELSVAGRLARFGQEITDAEPDIRLLARGRPFLIACKCLESEKRILPAISEGRAQITRQGHPGIIVVDLSRLVEMDELAHGLDEEAWWRYADSRCKAMLRDHAPRMSRRAAGGLVKSVVFRITRSVPVMAGGIVTLSTLDYFLNVRIEPDGSVAEVLESLARPDVPAA